MPPGVRHGVPGWVARTDAPVHIRDFVVAILFHRDQDIAAAKLPSRFGDYYPT